MVARVPRRPVARQAIQFLSSLERDFYEGSTTKTHERLEALMRRCVVAFVLAAVGAGTATGAWAQSIVDLSKPQPGKSRFVLNADMTPADLGVRDEQKVPPAAAASRIPACGEGCTMYQPTSPRAAGSGYSSEAGAYRSGNNARGYFVAAGVGNTNAAHVQAKPEPRKTFRSRRR
jgi:hypothetical protein